MMRIVRAGVAVACVVSGLVGCATRPHDSPLAAAAPGVATPSTATPVSAAGVTPPCPSGSPLPAGHGESRDYVDAVYLNGHEYVSAPGAPGSPAKSPALGAVLAKVRCSIYAHDSTSRTEPEKVEPGSTFVPEGNPIYEVLGVPVECEVAANSLDGELHLYARMPQDRPASCPN